MRLSDIAQWTQGNLFGDDTIVHLVATDSRVRMPGALFVALSGDNFDGHDFVAAAKAEGAAAARPGATPRGRLARRRSASARAPGTPSPARRCEACSGARSPERRQSVALQLQHPGAVAGQGEPVLEQRLDHGPPPAEASPGRCCRAIPRSGPAVNRDRSAAGRHGVV